MEPVYLLQFKGLCSALITALLFYFASNGISTKFWPLCYQLLIMMSGGTLTFLAIKKNDSIIWTTVCFLCCLALVGILRKFKTFRDNKPNKTTRIEKPELFFLIVAVSVLLIELLYASFPVYRFDQWNYNLIVSKRTMLDNGLNSPIYAEHVFFTGVYEFLFTVPRLFTDNDMIVQSYANSFGFISFIILALGFIYLWRRLFKINLPNVLVLAAFFYFSMKDRHAITNCKPDFLLIYASLTCFTFIKVYTDSMKKSVKESFLSWFLIGVFLVFPLGLKVTWLHFAAAFGFAVLFFVFFATRNPLKKILFLGLGGICGLILAFPYFFKNYYFFHNPIHPAQFVFFKSSRWSEIFKNYWDTVAGQAHSAKSFFIIFFQNFYEIPYRWIWFLVLIIPVTAWLIRTKNIKPRLNIKSMSHPFFLSLVLFVSFWPLFFAADIFSRFVFCVFSFVIFSSVILLARLPKFSPLVYVLLIIPVISNSSFETRIRYMWQNFHLTEMEYFKNKTTPLNIAYFQKLINEHRHRNFPNANYSEKLTIADEPPGYFLNSALVHLENYDYRYLLNLYVEKKGKPCISDFLNSLDVRYFYSDLLPFKKWPEKYQKILQGLKKIDDSGKILFAEDNLYKKITEEDCLDFKY